MTAPERSWAVFPAGSLGEYTLPRALTAVLARGVGATILDLARATLREEGRG